MELSVITELISGVGFPIAVCCVMFWVINKIQTEHKEEVNHLSEAIQNNTLAITKLVEKMEGGN